MNEHGESATREACNERDIADEIESELLVERCVDRVGRGDEQDRIAIGRCSKGLGNSQIAAGARLVLDDDRLPQTLRKRLADEACQDVRRAPSGRADQPTDGSGRIGLTQRGSRCCGQGGASAEKLQDLASMKCHVETTFAMRRWDARSNDGGQIDLTRFLIWGESAA